MTVRVSGLTFAYPKGPAVLDVPELVVGKGERVFLHGPSGSGKTTLLGILAGILTAGKGQVSILGTDFTTAPARERDRLRGAHIGYIFQMFNLIPYLSVVDNVLLPLQISPARKARVKGDEREAARALTAALGIDQYLDRQVTELSVGQQQRVAAARALIGAPELIIADEPTSALDSDHRHAFLKTLFSEAEKVGSSVLFVSHDHALKELFARSVSLASINKAAR